MIRSIRLKLFLSLFLGMLATSALAGGSVYLYYGYQLRTEADATLLLRARALSALIEYQPDGNIDMDFSVEAMPEFAPSQQDQFFEVWMPNGEVLERSPSLGLRDLPRLQLAPDEPQFTDTRLFDGRPARQVTIRALPHIELEEHPDDARKLHAPPGSANAPTYGPLPAASPREIEQLSLEHNQADLDRILTNLLAALVLAGLLMSICVPLIVMVAVHRGLKPLDTVARHAASLDDSHLQSRFPKADLPIELQPICERLNSLLERLDQAFARERRFTNNAAHELRTPIAELRALAEVALQYPPDAAANRAFYQDVLAIASGMEQIVAVLLGLARGDSAPAAPAARPCDLAVLAQEAWSALREKLAARQLHLNWQGNAPAPVHSDPVLLQAILHNLFVNAVEYAPAGSTLEGRLAVSPGCYTLVVENPTEPLTEADLTNFGEPFWRRDTARSPGYHAGLGLSLVRAYAKTLGAAVDFRLLTATLLQVTLTLPRPESAPQPLPLPPVQ